jgi:hypothetical protein
LAGPRYVKGEGKRDINIHNWFWFTDSTLSYGIDHDSFTPDVYLTSEKT